VIVGCNDEFMHQFGDVELNYSWFDHTGQVAAIASRAA
jgi:hypothetical protein